MSASGLLEFYTKMATAPEYFLKTFLFQIPQPVSPKKIWKVYRKTPDLRHAKIYNSFTHMKKSAVCPLLDEGVLVRGKAFDMPDYRAAGITLKTSEATRMRKLIERYPTLMPFKFRLDKDEIILENPKVSEYEDVLV